MFSLITNSMEERLELIKGSMSKEIALKELQKCESLEDFYNYSRRIKNGVISQMQLYVLENYEKVPTEYWNKSTFSILPHTGKEELLFGKEDTFEPISNHTILIRMEKERYKKSIKITSIKFILDFSDGDFSITFNNGPWTFLGGDDILTYYYKIKSFLDEK